MEDPYPGDPSGALLTLTGGDESEAAQLMNLVYEELRALAGSYFQSGRPGQTLQPTALVHEAFLKVSARTGKQYADQAHFFAVCAVAMRNILADYARRRRTAKRGGGWKRVGLEDVGTPTRGREIDAIALDECLTRLSHRSERQARIVEYRYFSGMTIVEIARVLGVSRSTVENDWYMARAWLKVQLQKGETP